MIIKIGIAILLFTLPAANPAAASPADPMAVLKAPIEAMIVVLNDPNYKDPDAKMAQRNQIWKIVQPMFDFNEVSRRAVARHWQRFTEPEKKAFVEVFAQFLANTYIDKIQGEYQNEKVVYLSQAFHKEVYAEVKTKIIRESLEVPVNYRMLKNSGGQWKVYDIIVEGISLVKNYRTQFASILKKKKPAQLIDQLNEKLAEQNRRLSEEG
jgi:phospholipid transport system substrate-binding protein